MTGIELIAQEREEQLSKHNISIQSDSVVNADGSIIEAVIALLQADGLMDVEKELLCPDNWNEIIWEKMISKSYNERLIIAGALLAAEYDRVNYEK